MSSILRAASWILGLRYQFSGLLLDFRLRLLSYILGTSPEQLQAYSLSSQSRLLLLSYILGALKLRPREASLSLSLTVLILGLLELRPSTGFQASTHKFHSLCSDSS